jgi:hypothetical protein
MMRNPGFAITECKSMEADIRAMCDKLKLAAPPSKYSLEDAIEIVVREGTNCAQIREGKVRLVPAFTRMVSECRQTLSAIFEHGTRAADIRYLGDVRNERLYRLADMFRPAMLAM